MTQPDVQTSNNIDAHIIHIARVMREGKTEQEIEPMRTPVLARTSGELGADERTQLEALGVRILTAVGSISALQIPVDEKRLTAVAALPFVLSLEASR